MTFNSTSYNTDLHILRKLKEKLCIQVGTCENITISNTTRYVMTEFMCNFYGSHLYENITFILLLECY